MDGDSSFILEEKIINCYKRPVTGLVAMSKLLKLNKNLHIPKDNVIILTIGQHSTGKSSFINWFFGGIGLEIGASITTEKITFIRQGNQDIVLSSPATQEYYPFLKDIPENFKDKLQMKMLRDVPTHAKCVTFIDTPGYSGLTDDLSNVFRTIVSVIDLIYVFTTPESLVENHDLTQFLRSLDSNLVDKVVVIMSKTDSVKSKVELLKANQDLAQILTNVFENRSKSAKIFNIFISSELQYEREECKELENLISSIKDQVFFLNQMSIKTFTDDLDLISEKARKTLKSRILRDRIHLLTFATLLFVTMYLVAALHFQSVRYFKYLTETFLLVLLVEAFVFIFVKGTSKHKKALKKFLEEAKRDKMIISDFYKKILGKE